MTVPTIDTSSLPAPGIEWPTLVVLGLCYATILFLTLFGTAIPLWFSIPLLTVALAQHSSLQHEALHGHPFRNIYLNEALVFVPVGLFVPYRRFRDTHIAHHNDERLTDPYDDPESNFLDPAVWQSLNPVMRAILLFNNTLFGRILIGPLVGMASFYKSDLRQILKGNRQILVPYLLHLAGLVPLVWWLTTYSTLPVWAYVLAAYGGMSLLKIRTYLEHRAHKDVPARTVLIEDRGFWSLLFLNNNFHFVHHQFPKLPWYHIPRLYEENKSEFLRNNNGYVYKNYREIFRKYFFHRKDDVPHPLYRPGDNNHGART
ncbi:MAG TPA: fatty acid desaturase [Rhodobacteraceae bacterium]|nr:fatty acid desaturase [Paracoccaceae bacterium]